jgi:formylglycine-generating enzyme required for sulfatase activity
MLIREDDGALIVKVIDFGLVKSALIGSTAGALTSTGFVGTPYFASPEQLDQRSEDIRSDIYSLGVTLWFMLTGKPTFLGSVASVIMQHLEKAPSFNSLAVLPPDVVGLLRRMLEKDVEKRFQTPTELRAEIKRCLASLRGADETVAPLHDEKAEPLQAVALSGSRGLRDRPDVGSVVGNRYRLIEDLNPGNPHRTFHAEDTEKKRRVRVKLVDDDDALFRYLEVELEKLKAGPNPNFIEVLAAVRPATRDAVGYVVLEWIDGFSLCELLRVRHELTPREVASLLEQIAPALDAAKRLGIKPELSLRDILVAFPESSDAPEFDVMLRCPLAERPTFMVKLNPLGRLVEFESSDPSLAGQTMVPALKQGTEGTHAGRIAYDLLGGVPNGFAPLANLPEQGNEILRRCLNPETTYSTAGEFVKAFASFAVHETAPPPIRPAETKTPRKIAPVPLPVPPPQPAARPRLQRSQIIGGLAVVVVIASVAGLWPRSTPPATTAPLAAPKISTPAAPVALARQPPRAGKIWTNSLGMAYVPLDGIHFAKTETRVRDFDAFVTAKGYDAIGGMYSLQRDGFKQHGHSWKNPGFSQTPEHPVVGVSWEDANQFCAWLTQKERAEGVLTAAQVYRLPTDREWSIAVGLVSESGATPEERSGKVKGVYPWGKTFPPPADAGNYAGSEARPNTPDRWPTVVRYQDAFPRTCAAASFAPNRLGVVELGGNVWEWCMDSYNKSTRWRVLRGGSWATSSAEEMLSSYRRGFDPSFRHDDVGFRCVIATEGR